MTKTIEVIAWQYLIALSTGTNLDDIAKNFNNLGAFGWEFAGVMLAGEPLLIFKRPTGITVVPEDPNESTMEPESDVQH